LNVKGKIEIPFALAINQRPPQSAGYTFCHELDMTTNTTSTPCITTRSGTDRRVNNNASALVFLRLPDVMALSGLSRSAIYAAIQRNAFPRPVTLNPGRARAWIKSEVVEWMAQCIRNSRSDAPERRQHPSR